MLGENWTDFIDKDLPEAGPITEETCAQSRGEAARYRGSVRVSTGRIWTDREYKDWRDRVLSTPLP